MVKKLVKKVLKQRKPNFDLKNSQKIVKKLPKTEEF